MQAQPPIQHMLGRLCNIEAINIVLKNGRFSLISRSLAKLEITNLLQENCNSKLVIGNNKCSLYLDCILLTRDRWCATCTYAFHLQDIVRTLSGHKNSSRKASHKNIIYKNTTHKIVHKAGYTLRVDKVDKGALSNSYKRDLLIRLLSTDYCQRTLYAAIWYFYWTNCNL